MDEFALRVVLVLKSLPPALLPLLARKPMPNDPDVVRLHPMRDQIIKLVRGNPGMSIAEIRDAIGLSYSETHRHVEKLEAADLVRRGGTPPGVYPADHTPEEWSVLQTPTGREVAKLLVEQPGLSSGEIEETIGASRSTVALRLAELVSADYVTTTKVGRTPTYHPTEKLRKELSRN